MKEIIMDILSSLTLKDTLQIILIPLLTVILTKSIDFFSKRHERNIANDRETFKLLKESFEGQRDLVYFFRDHSVGDSTNSDDILSIIRLSEKLDSPGFVFTIKKLEKLRIKLLKNVRKFLYLTSHNLFPHTKNSGFLELKYSHRAKYDMDQEAVEKFTRLYKEIDEIGTRIYNVYKQLSETAQKKL